MRAQDFSSLLLMAFLATALATTSARMNYDYRKASRDPPISRPPQFILFS